MMPSAASIHEPLRYRRSAFAPIDLPDSRVPGRTVSGEWTSGSSGCEDGGLTASDRSLSSGSAASLRALACPTPDYMECTLQNPPNAAVSVARAGMPHAAPPQQPAAVAVAGGSLHALNDFLYRWILPSIIAMLILARLHQRFDPQFYDSLL
eukprot:Rhum_TRINITY_DN25329_c0_g1::Rhum_TRINITY_DN25329_c0_g1_i1::g.181865::m.181865